MRKNDGTKVIRLGKAANNLVCLFGIQTHGVLHTASPDGPHCVNNRPALPKLAGEA